MENVNNNNNRSLNIGFSGVVKTYLINHIVLRKQVPISIFTKSLSQYREIEIQSSDEIQPSESYENSVVVFDDTLLSKQESNIDFFTRGRRQNNDKYYIFQSYFNLPKNTIRNNSNIIILSKQTLRDIILLFHDRVGLDMNLEQWKELCR